MSYISGSIGVPNYPASNPFELIRVTNAIYTGSATDTPISYTFNAGSVLATDIILVRGVFRIRRIGASDTVSLRLVISGAVNAPISASGGTGQDWTCQFIYRIWFANSLNVPSVLSQMNNANPSTLSNNNSDMNSSGSCRLKWYNSTPLAGTPNFANTQTVSLQFVKNLVGANCDLTLAYATIEKLRV